MSATITATAQNNAKRHTLPVIKRNSMFISNHIQYMKRENQQDATIRCLLLLSQHVSDIIMPIFRRTKALLLHLVCCSGFAGCGW